MKVLAKIALGALIGTQAIAANAFTLVVNKTAGDADSYESAGVKNIVMEEGGTVRINFHDSEEVVLSPEEFVCFTFDDIYHVGLQTLDAEGSGISVADDIVSAASPVTLYRLDGTVVAGPATRIDLRNHEQGVYIAGDGNRSVKILYRK